MHSNTINLLSISKLRKRFTSFLRLQNNLTFLLLVIRKKINEIKLEEKYFVFI